jgi:BASS family bile acid:Na+ symporter
MAASAILLAPLQWALRGLSFIGRYGTQGFAISIFLGIALPQFAAAARPFLAVSIFVFTAMTFARADWPAIRTMLVRPHRLVLALTWLLVAPVAMVLAVFAIAGTGNLDPGLVLGLSILAAAPPIMSGPAVAMMLKVEPSLILSATIAATVLSPLIAPPLADWIAGASIPLDASVLALRLVWLIGGAVVAAALFRWLVGIEKIRANGSALDGLGVVMYFIFAIAAMDGVTDAAMRIPGTVASFLLLALALAFSGFCLAMLVLAPFMPRLDRFTLGYGTGQRNMGLLVAALGSTVPPTTFLFFALAQIPIYLAPLAMRALAHRLNAAPRPPASPPPLPDRPGR